MFTNLKNFVCCALLFPCIAFASINTISDDIETKISLIKVDKKDTAEVNRLNAISLKLKKKGDFTEGLQVTKQAIDIAEKIRYSEGLVDAYINEVGMYEALGKNQLAKNSLNKGFVIANKINYKKGLVLLYRNSGVLNIVENNYPKAIEDFYKSLKIAEEINYKQGITYAYNNIGNLNYEQGNYEEARKNYMNTLKLSVELKDSFSLAYAYNNLGYVAKKLGQFSEAMEFFKKSLEIKEKTGDKRGICNVLRNIGDVKQANGNYNDALIEYNEALKIALQINDQKAISEICVNLGRLNLMLKQYAASRNYLKKALKLSNQIGGKLLKIEIYNLQSKLDSCEGNFKSAFENSKNELRLLDSIKNEKSTLQIAQLKVQYETEKKNKELSALRYENEIQKQNTYQKNLLILLITAASLFIIILIAIQNMSRKKELIIAKKSLEFKSLEIQKAKVEERVKVQREISEQYHDILGYKITSILLMCENAKKNLFQDKMPLYDFVSRINNKLKEVAETNRSGIIALSSDSDELESFIGELRADLSDLAETTGKEISFQITENIPSITVEPIFKFNISAAMKEAINNSLKYANCSFVEVKIEVTENGYKIVISDAGIGISNNQKNHHGYGMINMKNRIKSIGGSFLIDSKEGYGTKVVFEGYFNRSNFTS
jgi:signal transduction histidine kinase